MVERLEERDTTGDPECLDDAEALREFDTEPLALFVELCEERELTETRGENDDVIVNVIDPLDESLGLDDCETNGEYEGDELTDKDTDEDPEYEDDLVS